MWEVPVRTGSPLAGHRLEGEYADMKKSLIGLAIAALLSAGAVSVVTAPAEAGNAVIGSVTVTGTGSMTLKRDQATTSLSVTYLAKTAKEALASATATYNMLRKAIVDAGVKTDNITTGGISLYPEYEYIDKVGSQLKGYRATLSMSVVTTVPLAATVLDTAVSVGGDAVQIGGVSFDVANPDAVTDTSRVRAIASAKMKAQDYAEALGEKLGRATKVVENGSATPTPIYYAKAAVAAADSAVEMDPGTQKVTSNVTVTFELLG